MRFSDQLRSMVKNVSTELTLEEHLRLRTHAETEGKTVNTVLRELVLKVIPAKSDEPGPKREAPEPESYARRSTDGLRTSPKKGFNNA